MSWNSITAAKIFYQVKKNKKKKANILLEGKSPKKPAKAKRSKRDRFFSSQEWLELRYVTLTKYGRKCMCCGSVASPFHVDHIKPRSKYPKLALDPNNLQVLCEPCNLGKSNKYEDDFREI